MAWYLSGHLSSKFYNWKSLVCDPQEPFRCIVDRIIKKKAYGLGQIKDEDFVLQKLAVSTLL